VHIYVADVDGTYRRALEAGATSVQEPVKKLCTRPYKGDVNTK
jgi:uncharacterized glyoxalase superfamily protein PhnB